LGIIIYWCANIETVGIARENIKLVKKTRVIKTSRGNIVFLFQPLQQFGYSMSPKISTGKLNQGFNGFLRRLMSRKTSPIVISILPRILGMLEIAKRLLVPVLISIRHGQAILST
jgi:hypothetical protein